MRKIADLTHRYAGDHARTTVEQNIVLRWVPENKVVELYKELKAIGLSQPGAGTIVDVTACPGTDTCKLGIASSRGLAGELRNRLAEKSVNMDEAIKHMRIKVSPGASIPAASIMWPTSASMAIRAISTDIPCRTFR
jgi:sulfite reductase (ferredoxin)